VIKRIEKRPPAPTGDEKQDIRQIVEYQNYLYEQLNYILSLIDRKLNEGGQ